MPSKFKIKDIAVVAVAQHHEHIPTGEAPGEHTKNARMTPDERVEMLERLSSGIDGLLELAHTSHLHNCKIPGTDTVNPDYITRLSTNEFFFYTQEPLTIKEFEASQQWIATKAKELPSGIHLVLGSFAVKTPDNFVMSVVPHITCGQPPQFHFIVKNNASRIDVRYKEKNAKEEVSFLKNIERHAVSTPLPQLTIEGIPYSYTFNNIVSCKTPRGELFFTAVDICIDHGEGVAKTNIDRLITETPAVLTHPISHMVISNSIDLYPEHCLGRVMHVDPQNSVESCMAFVKQIENEEGGPCFFGKDEVVIFDLEPQVCSTIQEAIDFPMHLDKAVRLLEQIKFGDEAQTANDFIRIKLIELMKANTDQKKQRIISELNSCFEVLESNEELRCLIPLHAALKTTVEEQIEFILNETVSSESPEEVAKTATAFKHFKERFKEQNTEPEPTEKKTAHM